ncbi:MAG: hypothetical protein UH850_07435 [Paludibacteraceae bacterium]|nr:hypothetical protein [Paludibacteraceae bacterium]
MKKLILFLSSAFVSLSAFASLDFDNPYWVIKNGRMTNNISYVPYDDLGSKVPNEMIDTTINGENVVVYKQLSQHYLDVRVQFNPENKLDLSKNYVMVFEYKIPESHGELNLITEGNKPLFIFGFSETAASLSKKNCTEGEAYCMIDAKWGVTDEWVTVYKYIYSDLSIRELEGMIFSYAREYKGGDMTEFPCIKNLGFVSIKEGKPFYAENFDGVGLGAFYYETNDISEPYPIGTGNLPVTFLGGVKPIITDDDVIFGDDNGRPALTAFRDFRKDEERHQDGSGYLDDELLHALQIEPYRDSVIFPGIKIPTGTETIFSKMLLKKHKNEKGLWKDADSSVYSNEDLPILLKFNTGEIIDLAKDTIKPIWTMFEGEVKVPAGAESFDLIFHPAKAGYLIDDIMLSSKRFADVKVDQVEADAFDIVAYVDENGDIVVVNGELVAAYNMEGRKATKADKIVAIIVKNDKGQLASKIILRK